MVGLLALIWTSTTVLGFQEIDPPKPLASIPLGPMDFVRKYETFDFHVRLELSQPTCRWQSFDVLTCKRSCKGGIHYTHEDCDTKCDELCRTKHTRKFACQPDFVPNNKYHDLFLAAMEKLGCPDAAKWRSYSFSAPLSLSLYPFLEQLDSIPRFNMTVSYPHWCTKPCSSQARLYARTVYKVTATWHLVREVTGSDGKATTIKSEPISSEIGTVAIDDPTTTKLDDVITSCRCRVIVGEKDPDFQNLKQSSEEERKKQDDLRSKSAMPPTQDPSGAMIPKTNLFLGPKDIEKLQFKIVCQDLNAALCTAVNPYDVPFEFCINPGTACIPSDDHYQSMVVCSRTRILLPPRGPVMFWVSLAPSPAKIALGTQTTIACLEMQKDEPDPSVSYSLEPSPDEGLVALARIVNGESFKGSWDQARFWIYTDHATFTQIQKRLIPAPGAGTYIRLLYDVATAAGIDFTEPDYRPCIDPALLYGLGSSSSEATQWFMKMCEQLDPKGLTQTVSTHMSDFAALAANKSQELYLQRLADIGTVLSQGKNESVALAGIELLIKAVPDECCSKIASKGGLLGAIKALSHTSPKVQLGALKIIERYQYLPAYPEVSSLANASVDEAVKAEAVNVRTKLLAR